MVRSSKREHHILLERFQFLKFEVIGNHVVELLLPIFIILPFRKLRIISGISVIVFMTIIGNVQGIKDPFKFMKIT